MGYQFYNNFPYSDSSFPTMISHVDVVGNVFFTGLNTEIANIENVLGLSPAGAFNTVKDRFINAESRLTVLENVTHIDMMTPIILNGGNATLPVTAPATISTIVEYQKSFIVVSFPHGSTTYASFNGIVPRRSGSSNLTIKIYARTTGTSGNSYWINSITVRALGVAFTGPNSETDTWQSTLASSDESNKVVCLTHVLIGSYFPSGSNFLLRLVRYGNQEEDTLAEAMEILTIIIEESW